jgi:hypothetical protein
MNSAMTPTLVSFLEELSARTLLESLLPRLFGDLAIETRFIVFHACSSRD